MPFDERKYRIHSIFDTETSNIVLNGEHRAICCLYIFNDVSRCELADYVPDCPEERLNFLRHDTEALAYIDDVVNDGVEGGYIPVICAYNLLFDMQTLLFALNDRYRMRALARSSTHAYTVDLLTDDGNVVCRFWDTYNLEMGGLGAMGRICGVGKATGEWDYSLVRTSETPLTAEELHYAARDVQVIPAFLRYLLEANPFIAPEDLGHIILTKTSITRQMAKHRVGNLRYRNRRGKVNSLRRAFELTCKQECAKSYEQYATRKACFYGGFTFTSARFASRIQRNVASLDVTSMHHAFINGRYIPVHFSRSDPETLLFAAENILETESSYILDNYEKPFLFAFHALFRFKNIRLRPDTAFERWRIALIPKSKFKAAANVNRSIQSDPSAAAEESVKTGGYVNRAINAVFGFGKLYSAERCEVWCNEIELYALSLVYQWDSIEALGGESTIKFARPPDYIMLQSHILFAEKDSMKAVLKDHGAGRPFTRDFPGLPQGLREALIDGTADSNTLESYYNSTIKGTFNSIYGSQAQDEFKPDYLVDQGELYIDRESLLTEANFSERKPRKPKALYTYGMRIVGGSRLHLVLAIKMLYEAFGDRLRVLGGDTDSIKLSCNEDITDGMLLSALEPLHTAVDAAIIKTSARLRENHPDLASDLRGVGHYEVESCGLANRYPLHMEAWNKARVSLDSGGKAHITCAGLSRPAGSYTIEDYITDLMEQGASFEAIAPQVLGYNVTVENAICHFLERTNPLASARIISDITDYLGHTAHVDAPEAICLYPQSRIIGDTDKGANAENVYMLEQLGVEIDIEDRALSLRDGKAVIDRMGF